MDGTVSIPLDKLGDVQRMVSEWKHKHTCSRRQLQSLLGVLFYIHKCIKPARCLLNTMLPVLHHTSNPACIILTDEFHKDLCWFDKFLPMFIAWSQPCGVCTQIGYVFDRTGGCWSKFFYLNLDTVHLEMPYILMAVCLFGRSWSGRRVLIKCDNDTVVLQLVRPFLGACAQNIWLEAAIHDIDTIHPRHGQEQLHCGFVVQLDQF